MRRPDDELVLAGIRGDGLPGDPYGPPADYFAPLSLAMLATCPTDPPPEIDSGCSFICGDCYRLRRGSMRLAWQDGATVDLIDRSTQFWPGEPYLVLAGAVEFHDEITCTDTPDRWARVMLLRYKH